MRAERYAVIDVETPNCHNDSICSIGIVILEDGFIAKRIHQLINPEVDFDEINISIHGITPADVETEPTFPEAWEALKDVLKGCLLVGHNIRFDLSCIKKALQYYQIESTPIYYIDTMTLSKECIKNLRGYRLNDLCDYFDIELDDHHNALCDSTATAELFLALIDEYDIDIENHITKYDFNSASSPARKSIYTENTKALQELEGVLSGVICDDELNDGEILFIKNWLDRHKELKGNYPYDKIYLKIEDVLEDGIITESERGELFALVYRIINPVEEASNNICITIKDSSICLTGEFECMSRHELSDLLESRGAIIKKGVSKTLDYLFVGDKGSDKWIQGNYGSKIKKAMEFNEKGANIEILKESDVISAILNE